MIHAYSRKCTFPNTIQLSYISQLLAEYIQYQYIYSDDTCSTIVGSVYTIQMYTLENSLSPKQRHHQTVKYPPIVDGIYSIPIYSTDTYSPIVGSVYLIQMYILENATATAQTPSKLATCIYPPIVGHTLTIPIIQLTYIPHPCPKLKFCTFYILCTCIICTCSIFYIAISFLMSLGPQFSRNKSLFWYFEKSCICVFVFCFLTTQNTIFDILVLYRLDVRWWMSG